MKRTSLVVSAIVGVLLATSPLVLATDSTPGSLAGCAALLPAGQSYSFQMSGTIDITSGKPVMTGTFTVDDGTKVERHSENAAFGKCVAALIGA